MVAIVSTDCSHLTTLTRFCQTALLSNVALSYTTSIPTETTQTNGVLTNLIYLLSSLPHIAPSQLSSLPTSFHPLLFNLTLLHSTLHHHCQLSNRPTPNLSLFSSSISLLCSLTNNHQQEQILKALQTHAMTVYSTCCNGPILESLVNSCLDLSAVVPGTNITLTISNYGNIEVVTPGPGVPLNNYGDHVMGMMSSDIHKTTDTLRYNRVCVCVCVCVCVIVFFFISP